MGRLCFISSFGEFVESFFHCWEVGFVRDVGERLGLVAHDELERGFSSGRVWADVVNEFCHGDIVGP